MVLVDAGVGEDEPDAEKNGQGEERFIGQNGLPSPSFLQILRQTADQCSERSHDGSDKGIGGKDAVSVLRAALFGQQRLFHRIERAASLSSRSRGAGADIGDDHR